MINPSAPLQILTTVEKELILDQSRKGRSAADGFRLLEGIGQSLAEIFGGNACWGTKKILFLCGEGLKGTIGLLAAAHLAEVNKGIRAKANKIHIEVACTVSADKLAGYARRAAEEWGGDIIPFDELELAADGVVVDAIIDSGVSEPIEGWTASILQQVAHSGLRVIAVDVPSGLDPDSGIAALQTVKAFQTVALVAKSPGHVLMPGAEYCGHVMVEDCAVSDDVMATTTSKIFENMPLFWREYILAKDRQSNKYDHGHVVVFGGRQMPGAAILASMGAMRMGAGLCTVVTHPDSALAFRAANPGAIVEEETETARFRDHLKDPRRNTVLIGPGAGLDNRAALKKAVIDSCAQLNDRKVVLDADAITVFEDDPKTFYRMLGPHVVLTPHEGEFARIFPEIRGMKTDRARQAAALTRSIVVLKGPDTVIAHPDGRCVINAMSSPWLATGGTGDVLAGMIVGLLARDVDPFLAACAAVYMHGRAGVLIGPGLIAADIPGKLPAVWHEI